MTEYAEIVPLNWSELAVSELPTGTVTLLLADVEGSTRLWETRPREMASAIARLNTAVSELVAAHGGVRPLEQGEGDSFVVGFARASDAVACALALQQAPLEPIRLRIGVHSGEIQLRDDANYAGPTINRTARIRDLAHGGQTVVSGATEALVVDRLPAEAWLADLGSHALKDLPRPERVFQLHHPDIRAEFPPLRSGAARPSSRLPVQLTSFVGRVGQVEEIRHLLENNRLVTLTGAGGVGKTRLAVRAAADAAAGFDGGVYFVDLSSITDPAFVPITVARGFDLADQPGRSVMDTITRFLRDRKMLVVLDNCEHLLDSCSTLVAQLLHAGEEVAVLATSREPIGIAGELTWRVPSLSTDDEAVELFTDRARRAGVDVTANPQHTGVINEICRRLDGMPLAIELAAARTRTLSLPQILDSLRSSFRVLTGGARTAVRRQQTLSASIDWSHSLLTEPERILLRRLAAFAGGFDIAAASSVAADGDNECAQLIDVLGLLVDKSLVIADDSGDEMRYRLLETVRQYGLEKLAASGEADVVRIRHRDYYAATVVLFEAEMRGDGTPLVPWAATEMDNLRAAYAWSCENAEFESALAIVSALRRLWETHGRFREGLAGFDTVFADERYRDADVATTVWVRAVADAGILAVWLSAPANQDRVLNAIVAARDTGDDGLTARILLAAGLLGWDDPDNAGAYLAEGVALARAVGDDTVLCEGLSFLCCALVVAGLPGQARCAGEEGRALADRLGDSFMSRYCRAFLCNAVAQTGRLGEAITLARDVIDEARACGDRAMEAFGLVGLGFGLTLTGAAGAGAAAGAAVLGISADLGGFHEDSGHAVLAWAALARGDAAAALQACEAGLRLAPARKELIIRSQTPMVQALMCCGDLAAARRWADETVPVVLGIYRTWVLTARARVAVAQGEPGQADRDCQDVLAFADTTGGHLLVPDALECLATLAAVTNPIHAARLLGAADSIYRRHQQLRFAVFDADYEATVATVREALGADVFEVAWLEGEALTTAEAIAFAQRGRGERKRPASGWESLTPTEHDVVRLLGEGLSNKEIGARLFISPRTVQTHLTHVYSKLNLSSRVQVAQAAARRC